MLDSNYTFFVINLISLLPSFSLSSAYMWIWVDWKSNFQVTFANNLEGVTNLEIHYKLLGTFHEINIYISYSARLKIEVLIKVTNSWEVREVQEGATCFSDKKLSKCG